MSIKIRKDYGQYESDYRTRAEIKNSDDIKLEKNS